MSSMTMRTSRRTTRRGRIHPLQIVETRSDLFSTMLLLRMKGGLLKSILASLASSLMM